MNYKHKLKFRITFSFVIFGALLSAVFATGTYFVIEKIEQELMESSMEAELEYHLKSAQMKTSSNSQISASITQYFFKTGELDQAPGFLQNLTPGSQEVKNNGQHYYIRVAPLEKGTLFLVKDATQFEQRETTIQYSLIAIMLVTLFLAFWVGISLSGRVISPVSSLARRVSRLVPGEQSAEHTAEHYAEDEVGQLASTFDRHLEQLARFIEREQEFTANASHELRTPMTIINFSAELLLDNPQLPKQARRQVERIARAGARMAQTIEVLLLLAREPSPNKEVASNERCNIKEISLELCEQHRFLTQGKTVTLHCEIINDIEVNAPKAVVAIVIGNLVRNALTHTKAGEVVIRVDTNKVEVKDTGPGIAEAQLDQVFNRHYRSSESIGSGIGLSIVKRICERQQWQISIESEMGRGTTVHLVFNSPTA